MSTPHQLRLILTSEEAVEIPVLTVVQEYRGENNSTLELALKISGRVYQPC